MPIELRMEQKPELQAIRQALDSAQSFLVVIPQNPSFDQMAASLSLYLSLKKMTKSGNIICPETMTVEFSSLVGVDQVAKEMGGKNLVISFDYLQDSIEKVSYNVADNKFNLVIQPKAGFPPLDAKKVSYSFSGIEADIIFVTGAQKLTDLGSFYEEARNLFQEKPVVNLNLHSQNSQFGKINLIQPQASSYSEIVAMILKTLNFPSDEDIANNLLLGLKAGTDNFQSPQVTAETFEAAAFCLRSGARPPGKEKTLAGKEKKPPSSPDWLAPKIYKGTSRI